jgi:hypothetical protein
MIRRKPSQRTDCDTDLHLNRPDIEEDTDVSPRNWPAWKIQPDSHLSGTSWLLPTIRAREKTSSNTLNYSCLGDLNADSHAPHHCAHYASAFQLKISNSTALNTCQGAYSLAINLREQDSSAILGQAQKAPAVQKSRFLKELNVAISRFCHFKL